MRVPADLLRLMISIEYAFFIGWASAVVSCDWRRRLIPNSLVVTGAGCALLLSAFGHSPFGLIARGALAGLLVGAIALLPFYALGMMGAADVKLFAALGAWCGPRALLDIWIVASLLAFVHALMLLVRRRGFALTLREIPADASTADRRRNSTPYGALLALAALGHLGVIALGARS